ncbi:unnamed protein product (macronuclear) [Paramecium tetraurelia]|uniref:Palmitoyltransferase n=1 Tax=Paramecium tetraurelia TaxID=5888 RepID=A0E6Q2_PARTE|nr:uncharacterized protein GSPATT00023697001 [Paramecium tetraurelia]CAK90969.1 unnamed protein product [Paramecium tetraurelia]|eukprot:XP_001458366.1 hypothetical protein (macronuclear) [Paramecium tetraurelia strain d4-2]
MLYLAILILLLLLVGASLYLLVCVDPNSPGFLGDMNRFVFFTLPETIKKICGDKIFGVFKIGIKYFFFTNHPIVQIFYVIVAMGGYLIYFFFGCFTLFGNNPFVSHVDTVIGSIMAILSFYSFFQACKYRPGIITKENNQEYVKEFKEYYDNVVYLKDNQCSTCNIIKPARSKHCRVCNVCVSKFDHHCVWIKQCVGQKNYKYFVKFIILHAMLCDYGAYLGFRCIWGIIVKENLFEAKIKDPYTGQTLKASWSIIIMHLLSKNSIFIFLIIMCIIMGISLTCFSIYHLYMIGKDTTSNERMKRSEFLKFFQEETSRIEKSLKDAKTQEEIKELSDKLEKIKSCKNRTISAKSIGIWKGLKQVYNQPDELDQKIKINNKKKQ